MSPAVFECLPEGGVGKRVIRLLRLCSVIYASLRNSPLTTRIGLGGWIWPAYKQARVFVLQEVLGGFALSLGDTLGKSYQGNSGAYKQVTAGITT